VDTIISFGLGGAAGLGGAGLGGAGLGGGAGGGAGAGAGAGAQDKIKLASSNATTTIKYLPFFIFPSFLYFRPGILILAAARPSSSSGLSPLVFLLTGHVIPLFAANAALHRLALQYGNFFNRQIGDKRPTVSYHEWDFRFHCYRLRGNSAPPK